METEIIIGLLVGLWLSGIFIAIMEGIFPPRSFDEYPYSRNQDPDQDQD